MTMQKGRMPQTYPDAVVRAMGLLSVDGVAEAVGKSPSLVRAWADPDRDSLPSIEQCEMIDRALVADGHDAVMLPVLRARVGRATGVHTPAHVLDRLTAVMEDVGELSGECRAALSPSGPGGRGITANEALQIAARAAEAVEELTRLIRDMEERESAVQPLRRAS